MRPRRSSLLVAVLVVVLALISAAKSKHSVTLTWQPPKLEKGTSVASYNVYRRKTKDHIYKKIAIRVAGPPYEDTTVKSGQTYIYAVSAIDQSGHEGRLSEVAQVKIPSP
jgi:fibronectin type 3 domain-containing protein